MLLVHPVTELRRFVVPLIGVFLFGATQGGGGAVAGIAALGIPVAIGVVRYLTTSYRIADGRIELQRGLFNRQRLSTPLDRVRTVDLTASVVHRVLRLSTVGIGTGTAGTDDRLELDALATTDAAVPSRPAARRRRSARRGRGRRAPATSYRLRRSRWPRSRHDGCGTRRSAAPASWSSAASPASSASSPASTRSTSGSTTPSRRRPAC